MRASTSGPALTSGPKKAKPAYERLFLLLIAAGTALRLFSLFTAEINLGPDEAQYWFWAQEPAFGYYSKPPLIAWVIGLTTAIFGNSEWAVRISAPLFHAGAATFIFLIGRHAVDARTGFWAAAAYFTMPGVSLSAALMTTDAPLLFFWTAALYFLCRLLETWRDDPGNRRAAVLWAVMLGGAIGLGALAKYAMVYFLLGLPFIAFSNKFKPVKFNFVDIALAGAAAAMFITPNIIWNLENDLSTISHTVDNANWTTASLKFIKMAEFIAAQFGVAGPITFAFASYGAWRMMARPKSVSDSERNFLLGFFLPAVAIVIVQALISRAHANWAAVSFPAAAIIAAAWALHAAPPIFARVFQAGIGVTTVVGIALMIALSNIALIEAAGASNAISQLRGWPQQGAEIAARAAGYDAVMSDDREIFGGLAFYAREGPPIVAWNPNDRIDNHYEAFFPYSPERDQRVLYVTTYADAAPLKGSSTIISPVGMSVAPIGPSRVRTLYLFEVIGRGASDQ